MKSWFSQRGYLQKLIETEASKDKFSVQRVFHRKKVEKDVPLVVKYHPCLNLSEKLFMVTCIYYIRIKN